MSSIFGMLSIDSNVGIWPAQRKIFNEELRQRGWVKMPKSQTTWLSTITPSEEMMGEVREILFQKAKDDVSVAATLVDLADYSVALSVSSARPVIFSSDEEMDVLTESLDFSRGTLMPA